MDDAGVIPSLHCFTPGSPGGRVEARAYSNLLASRVPFATRPSEKVDFVIRDIALDEPFRFLAFPENPLPFLLRRLLCI